MKRIVLTVIAFGLAFGAQGQEYFYSFDNGTEDWTPGILLPDVEWDPNVGNPPGALLFHYAARSPCIASTGNVDDNWVIEADFLGVDANCDLNYFAYDEPDCSDFPNSPAGPSRVLLDSSWQTASIEGPFNLSGLYIRAYVSSAGPGAQCFVDNVRIVAPAAATPTPIPTLNEYGLMAMALLLAMAAAVLVRRAGA